MAPGNQTPRMARVCVVAHDKIGVTIAIVRVRHLYSPLFVALADSTECSPRTRSLLPSLPMGNHKKDGGNFFGVSGNFLLLDFSARETILK
jgi:hypothetical protein